ncbi:BrnA antitoxin family protein [Desulfovibrio sp. OttesenSCG-928-M14]|nr:BrnA antitoxin family protein [Desulfovibrio sp. OttesenSCG-928-M14]
MSKDKTISTIEEQIETLDNLGDKDIDYSDIPEILNWDGAERGKFYRPIKKPVTLRLDADVLEWFKHHHPKYQSAINAALRDYITSR